MKDPVERKNEILLVAEKLFYQKGYTTTTVDDILDAVSIAKGTFYYYFKSKEDVLNTIIDRHIAYGIEQAEQVIASDMPTMQKLLAVIMAQKPRETIDETLIDILHQKDNAQLHQRTITQTILHLSKNIAQVFEEGNRNGTFSIKYPLETAEFILAAAMVLFDDDVVLCSDDQKPIKIMAFLNNVERMTGAARGSFAEFVQAFESR